MGVKGESLENAIIQNLAGALVGPLVGAMGSALGRAYKASGGDAIARSSKNAEINVKTKGSTDGDIDHILSDSQFPDNYRKELNDNLPEDLQFSPWELPVRENGKGGKIYDRKISPQEMHDLTGVHGVEFALTQNPKTGKYTLTAGQTIYNPDGSLKKQSVQSPGDEYLLYHTHPSGSPIASPADLRSLKSRNRNLGQKSSHIIPYNKGQPAQLIQFNYNDTEALWNKRLNDWINADYP